MMKLSKDKLIKMLKPHLANIGYSEFKDTIYSAQGFFAKKVKDRYYLSLGMTIHRYYDSAFTGDLYFCTNTRWGSVWGDIPNEIYKRPSYYMTDNEQLDHGSKDLKVEGSKDIWWSAESDNAILDFVKAIELVEPRIVSNIELITKIDNSIDIQILTKFSSQVKEIASQKKFEGKSDFTPKKEIDNIPLPWFSVAEFVLKEQKGILNANTVKMLAADAYRQYVLDNIVTE